MVILLALILPVIVFIFAIARLSHQPSSYVLVNGTQASLDQGIELANPLPTELHVTVGDSIFVTNKDVVAHLSFTHILLCRRSTQFSRSPVRRSIYYT